MSSYKISYRLRTLQRLLPIVVMATAFLYQFGPARFVHDHYGAQIHYWLEVLFYGTAGPVFIWFTIRVVRVWVEQKEHAEAEVYRLNSELQQRVDERTRELEIKAEALAKANAKLHELDQIKSEFVSLVSHEFRAPLTNMRGALELMGGNCTTLGSTCNRMLGIVNAEVDRLSRLVDDVLNVSRIEAGELKLDNKFVDLAVLVPQILEEFLARNVRRKFHYMPGPERTILWADLDHVHQVITNLLDNAVKYSPEQSDVTISTANWANEGILSVSDHGPGIRPEDQQHLFQKFSRLDSGDDKETYGYGLGLFLCRRLIEGMQGKIWVESNPGYGATFRFALPLAKNTNHQKV